MGEVELSPEQTQSASKGTPQNMHVSKVLTNRGTTCSTGNVVRDSSVEMDSSSHSSVRADNWAASSST